MAAGRSLRIRLCSVCMLDRKWRREAVVYQVLLRESFKKLRLSLNIHSLAKKNVTNWIQLSKIQSFLRLVRSRLSKVNKEWLSDHPDGPDGFFFSTLRTMYFLRLICRIYQTCIVNSDLNSIKNTWDMLKKSLHLGHHQYKIQYIECNLNQYFDIAEAFSWSLIMYLFPIIGAILRTFFSQFKIHNLLSWISPYCGKD